MPGFVSLSATKWGRSRLGGCERSLGEARIPRGPSEREQQRVHRAGVRWRSGFRGQWPPPVLNRSKSGRLQPER